jgi:hypothetical protein
MKDATKGIFNYQIPMRDQQ